MVGLQMIILPFEKKNIPLHLATTLKAKTKKSRHRALQRCSPNDKPTTVPCSATVLQIQDEFVQHQRLLQACRLICFFLHLANKSSIVTSLLTILLPAPLAIPNVVTKV